MHVLVCHPLVVMTWKKFCLWHLILRLHIKYSCYISIIYHAVNMYKMYGTIVISTVEQSHTLMMLLYVGSSLDDKQQVAEVVNH